MASGIVQWAIGKNTLVTLTPQDVAANGALSDNAFGSVTSAGRIEDVSDDIGLDTEVFEPMDGYIATPVAKGISGSYRITEIDAALPLVTSSNKGFGYSNMIRAIGRTSFYCKILIELYDNAGTPAVKESQTIYALMVAPRSTSRGRGKNTTSATFQLVDIYNTSTGARVANPAFA